ncbi:SRPBCC domain-containing protein [Streptomyces sp. NPDC127072]|uniref:SRPBCC domain-containing protein n=1 Tax=Streptomyces sp. NPDC127072 TaxID=3347129 RepID=UPI00365DAF73
MPSCLPPSEVTALISITDEIAVPSPPRRVWEVISSPSDVVSCISGAELGPSHEDGSFDGTLAVRFGGLRVKFAARITLDLDEPAHEGTLAARGADGQGATRFSAHATFRVVEGEAPGTSRIHVDGEIKLNGKLAKLIETGATVVVSKMTKEFSDQLVQRCAEPVTPTPSEPVTPTPSEPVTATIPGPRTATSAEPVTAASPETVTAAPRPAGLLGRLRAWWSGLRSRRHGQATRRSTNKSGEALGQGGRR